MARPIIAFSIEGDVDIETLATAVSSLQELVSALQDDHAPGSRVSWRVGELRAGSAHISLEAEETSPAARRIAESYETIAADLSADRTLECSAAVRRPIRKLARLTKRRGVRSVTFATGGASHPVMQLGPRAAKSNAATYADRGSVEGEVIALNRRKKLQLTLLDDLYDCAIRCHLAQEHAELAAEAWQLGFARITGLVTYQSANGHPIEVREVTAIECTTNTDEHWDEDWKAARGAIPRGPDDPRAEVLIRRMRDEW